MQPTKLITLFALTFITNMSSPGAQTPSSQQRRFLQLYDSCLERIMATNLAIIQQGIVQECSSKMEEVVTPTVIEWVGSARFASASSNHANVELWSRPFNAKNNVVVRSNVNLGWRSDGPALRQEHSAFVEQLVALNLRDGDPVIISGTLSAIQFQFLAQTPALLGIANVRLRRP